MVFLKHNLLIRVVIAFVIFYWKVNGDCMELLKIDGFDKRTGFQNLASKVANFEVKDEDTDFYVLQEYKLQVEKAIKDFDMIQKHLSVYGQSYMNHLIRLVKRPEQMQPPETWCKIFECLESNENLKSDTPFGNYINNASKKINENSPGIRYCYIKICHDTLVTPIDIPNKKNDQKTNGEIKVFKGFTGFKGLFFQTYNTYDREYFRLAPLTWCTIQACYNSILERGFDNVSVKHNRSSLVELLWSDKNTYVAEFTRFIDPTLVTKKRHFISSFLIKKEKNNSVPVNYNFSSPDSSYLYDLYEYPINWCAVKICHDDLINAGFTFSTFQENFYVLPKIKQALENNIGKRIFELMDEIVLVSGLITKTCDDWNLLFGNTIEYYSTEYINRYVWKLGAIIGNYLGKYTARVAVHLMNHFIGEFLGIKIKQYFTKKCSNHENEDPSLYIRMLFNLEYILLLDEKYKVYQSEFVSKYCFHLEKLKLKASEDTNKNYIPADREKRTPFDWCMFTVVHETLQL